MDEHQRRLPLRLYEIDLLRFLAAVFVLFFHYTFRGYAADDLNPIEYSALGKVFKYGYLGVELFFIISGYVVLMSAYNKTVRQFFISRVVRLYPAFWFACTTTFLVTYLTGPPKGSPFWQSPLGVSFRQYAVNMTMFQNFVGVRSLDGVYWTLTYELGFYLIIAFLLATHLIHRLPLILGICLVYLLTASLIDSYSSSIYLFLPSYYSLFIAGMLFYLLQKNLGNTWVLYVLLLSSLALSIQDAQLHAWENTVYYKTVFSPVKTAGIVCFFYAIFLLVIHRKFSLHNRKWITLVGALTYPLYLVHHNLGYLLFQYLNGTTDKYIILASILLLMFLLAYLIHIYIEEKYSPRFSKWLTLFLGRFTRQNVST
jgi:peptidoglycan/LPS O-acetylase OafA/YrhL